MGHLRLPRWTPVLPPSFEERDQDEDISSPDTGSRMSTQALVTRYAVHWTDKNPFTFRKSSTVRMTEKWGDRDRLGRCPYSSARTGRNWSEPCTKVAGCVYCTRVKVHGLMDAMDVLRPQYL